MAATTMYHVKDYDLYMSAKETAFRTSGEGKDTINAVGNTYYVLPIIPDGPITFRSRKNLQMLWSHGDVHPQIIENLGYEDVELTVSGPVIGHWLFMYFGTESCATADAAPVYTHVYNMATASPAAQPSFQMLMYLPNPTGAESVYVLGVGCVVTSYDEVANVGDDGTLRGTYTIKIAKLIAGQALTTPPTYADTPYVIYNSTLTWKHDATAFAAVLRSWHFHFGTDKRLVKGNSNYALYPSLANKKDCYAELTIMSYETDSYDESQGAFTTAAATPLDLDMTFKIWTNATTYYMQYVWVNTFQKLLDMGFEDGILVETHRVRYSPFEASSGLVITEVNDKVDDRYET